jgi:hypothetical protein
MRNRTRNKIENVVLFIIVMTAAGFVAAFFVEFGKVLSGG